MAKEFSKTIEVNGVTQVFEGDTQEELIEKLAEAQRNATVKISTQAGELRDLRKDKTISGRAGSNGGNGHKPRFTPKEPTAEEARALSIKLANPATAAEGFREALELGLGGTIEEIREALNAGAVVAHREHQFREGKKFRDTHPDFNLYAEEDRLKIEADIYAWMQARNLPFTAENIGKGYEDLGANELLPPRPDGTHQPTTEERQDELPAGGGTEANSSTRPRSSFSTGVRRGTGTPTPPTPPKRNPAEVWAEIDAMDDATFDRKLKTDPAFKALVDSLPAR